MAELGRLMDQARAAAQTDAERQRVALFERGVWQYMQAGRKTYLQRAGLRPTTMQQAQAPRIDGSSLGGDPRKANWSKAGVLGNWRAITGDETQRKIEARLLHDGTHLYLRLEEQLDTRKLVRTDDNVWNEDEWEIFVARQRAKPYRQMGVNANGVHIDLAWGEKSDKWDSGATVVSDTKAPGRWTVYVALPLAKLLPNGVTPGDKLYLNIIRSTQMKDALAWVPTFAGYHEPSRLGEIDLAK
jgi:hypothetical protein